MESITSFNDYVRERENRYVSKFIYRQKASKCGIHVFIILFFPFFFKFEVFQN